LYLFISYLLKIKEKEEEEGRGEYGYISIAKR
jgi:hypothetical protein